MTLIRNFTMIYLTYSPPIPNFPSIIHSTFSLHNRLQYKTAHKTQNSQQKKGTVPRPLDPFILYPLSKYTLLFQHDPMHRLHKIARLLSCFSLS